MGSKKGPKMRETLVNRGFNEQWSEMGRQPEPEKSEPKTPINKGLKNPKHDKRAS
jgi:hypothetical protein